VVSGVRGTPAHRVRTIGNPDVSRRHRVLVLDGHSKASAEVVLTLCQDCEVDVAATVQDCVAFASRRIHRRLQQPSLVEALQGWIQALDEQHDYALVLAGTEVSLLALKSLPDSRLRRKAVIPAEASIDVALSKQRTLEVARSLGIQVPHSTIVNRYEQVRESDRFPTVIKPVQSKVRTTSGVSSPPAVICRDARERERAFKQLLPLTAVVEQEYFRGRGVGIEVLAEHGVVRWLFAHERIHEYPVTGGASTYRRSIAVPEALRVASVTLLEHLGWHGVAMVEFKVDDTGDYRLIEINPRLWGSLPLAVAAGVNFPKGLLQVALGQPLANSPRYRRNHYARDVLADGRWFIKALIERRNPLAIRRVGPSDVLGLLRPLIGAEQWDLFRWRAPEMWLASTTRGLRDLYQGVGLRLARPMTAIAARRNWRRLRAGWRAGHVSRVVVLCYGNICRSPVVADLLRSSFPTLQVTSAGFHAQSGRTSPDDWAAVVRAELRVELREHRSASADLEDLEAADLVLVMDTLNWQQLRSVAPGAASKAVLLGVVDEAHRFSDADIADPYGQCEDQMKAIANRLQRCVQALRA
jgi:protein-tyrosine-phosphatase/predicted ATP-grasp superfamily ATP-dependent carboligase